MVAISESQGATETRWEPAFTRALEPGLQPLVLSRRDWERLLASYRDEGWRIILLSPDPPPGRVRGLDPSGVERFWFRGAPKRGSIPARVADLSKRVKRFAATGAMTGIEGVEVLLFWNSTAEVVELLEQLDDRLSEVGSPGLMLLRPRLLSQNEVESVAPGRGIKPGQRPACATD